MPSKNICSLCKLPIVGKKKTEFHRACRDQKYYEDYIRNWLSGSATGLWSMQISSLVKRYLIEIRGEKYESCGWCEINKYTGKIPLQIDHIDGNYQNNKPDNLKILCPNCHSLTPTYGGANRGNGRKNRHAR